MLLPGKKGGKREFKLLPKRKGRRRKGSGGRSEKVAAARKSEQTLSSYTAVKKGKEAGKKKKGVMAERKDRLPAKTNLRPCRAAPIAGLGSGLSFSLRRKGGETYPGATQQRASEEEAIGSNLAKNNESKMGRQSRCLYSERKKGCKGRKMKSRSRRGDLPGSRTSKPYMRVARLGETKPDSNWCRPGCRN